MSKERNGFGVVSELVVRASATIFGAPKAFLRCIPCLHVAF